MLRVKVRFERPHILEHKPRSSNFTFTEHPHLDMIQPRLSTMQSIDLGLGGLEIKAKQSELQLHLTSQARFAPSAKDDINTLCERLTSLELNNSPLHRPWITCDSTFQLNLSLLLEDKLSLDSQADLMHTLSERLRSAKVTPVSAHVEDARLTLKDMDKIRLGCGLSGMLHIQYRMLFSKNRSSCARG